MNRNVLVACLAALVVGGCSRSFFYSNAPAKTGWIYVVGSKNDRAQAWLCPATPGAEKCHEIEVEEVHR